MCLSGDVYPEVMFLPKVGTSVSLRQPHSSEVPELTYGSTHTAIALANISPDKYCLSGRELESDLFFFKVRKPTKDNLFN